jgi:two-component system chemotaxis response regulator CheB
LDVIENDLQRNGCAEDSPRTVLIIDDSRVMRAWLKSVLGGDPRLRVVAEAANATQARDILKSSQIDVLTLDIEMPGMNGLEFLTRLMRSRPMPVVMMSSQTAAGSDAAIKALSLGAIDCMLKPTKAFGPELMQDICDRVFEAACIRLVRQVTNVAYKGAVGFTTRSQTVMCSDAERRAALILIGASTGGVAALETLLPTLQVDGPPVVIVQHMPGNFLKSFAERLGRLLPRAVMLARESVDYGRGDIILAPGDEMHTQVRRRNGAWQCEFVPNVPKHLHCPAVDVLFNSAVPEAKSVCAALLTGLGKDGAEGMRALHDAGAQTFGQDEDSCVVYGMPRVAKSVGAVQQELPLDQIGPALNASTGRSGNARRMRDT